VARKDPSAPLAMALAICTAITAAAALTATADRYDPVTDKELASDARLARPVSVECARIYLGDLAERMTAQTGEAISADETSGASDLRIMASVREVPAWRVMAGVTGLLSYRLALWQWERKGEPGAAEYRLVRTRGAQSWPHALRERAQSEFERLTSARMRDTFRTPEQWTERLADPTPVTIEERAGWGLQVFAATLPEDAQKAVLRGEAKARLTVSRLPPWGKRLVEDLYNRMRPWRTLPDGSTAPAPFPEDLVAYTSHGRDPTPTLFIEMGDMGGYGYVGGDPLAVAFRNHVAGAWLGDADVPEHTALETAKLAATAKHELAKHPPLDHPWVALAERTDVPLLALAPVGRASRSFASEGAGTLGGYLRALGRRDYAIHKWRHGLLLVTYAAWFRDEQELHPCSWPVVRRLREACRSNSGLPTLGALVRVAVDLTPEQLDVLSDDWAPAKSLIPIRSTLEALDRDPELHRQLRDSGKATIKGPAARRAAASIGSIAISAVERVSLAVRTVGADGDRQLAFDVLFYDKSGNRLGGNLPRFAIHRPWAPHPD